MTTPRAIDVALMVLVASGAAVFLGGGTAIAESNSSSDQAIPADGPDYGVNETRFPLLWSDDLDHQNRSSDAFEDTISSVPEFSTRLAGSTDVPFEKPIDDVERWNSGDLKDFVPGGEKTSVHPERAHLEDGLYIRDAYTSIVAVQPSTVLHSGNTSTRYITPDGEVLAIADYRVRVPDDDTSGSVRHHWSIADTAIDTVVLQTDNWVLDADRGYRSTLEYRGLSGAQNLTVEATITARLRHETRTCTDYNSTTGSCEGSWEAEVDYPTEQVTATDSRHAVVTQIDDRGGKRVTFESDATHTGVVIHPGTRWSAIDIGSDARLRGNWRFYSAGVDGWQTMVSRTETETTRTKSSVRPAQLHAIPTQKRPDMPSKATEDVEPPLVIEEAWGSKHAGPSLSSEIAIPTVDNYTNATSIAVRSETLSAATFDEVTVHGIVRGQSETISVIDNGTVRDTTLELTVLEANLSGTLVQATVTETTTGEPVTTGRVDIGNQSAALNASGMAVLELEKQPSSLIDGQYVPADWWRADQLYSAAEDRTTVPPNYPMFQKLVQLFLVTLLWFLPVALAIYGFDYLTGGAVLGLREHQ